MKKERELIEEKGGKKMKKERELIEEKGGKKMKENKELIEEISSKRLLLMKKVLKWAENLRPVKDKHVKIKGRYYPLLEKETGKLYVIDKVQGKRVPFDTLDDSFKFVIISVLAERKEEIEKEVEEDKRKYLEGKLKEIDELLNKF